MDWLCHPYCQKKKCIACKNAVKFIIKNLLYQSQPLIKLNKHYIWTVFHKTFVVWLLHIKCRFSSTALASCQSAVKFVFQNNLLRLQSSISSSPKFCTIQLELLNFTSVLYMKGAAHQSCWISAVVHSFESAMPH